MANKLDREEVSHYNLLVQAVDNYEYGFVTGESRKAFHQIYVKILDVNDETPIINKPSSCAQVNEFLPIRETVTVVTATDKDDSNTPNGRVRFSIVDGNSDGLFDIEPIKILPTQSPHTSAPQSSLARGKSTNSESMARIYAVNSLRAHVANYSLIIRAEDEGSPSKWSTQSITICVADINDRNPIFQYPPSNHTIRIPENSTIGSLVVEVKAIDDDHGLNSVVNYKLRELSNGHWRTFKIDKNNGKYKKKFTE